MITFGWSASDLAAAIEAIVRVSKAFKEVGGAADHYEQAQNFLTSFSLTIERLKRYIQNHPDENDAVDLAEQVRSIDQPWKAFERYLNKYNKSLAKTSHGSRLAKAPRIIQYALNELNDGVAKLETAIVTPLHLINAQLSLEIMDAIEKLPAKICKSDQLAQLVDTARLAYTSIDIGPQLDALSTEISLREAADTARSESLTQLIESNFSRLDELLTNNASAPCQTVDTSRLYLSENIDKEQTDVDGCYQSLQQEIHQLRNDITLRQDVLEDNDKRKEADLTGTVFQVDEEQEMALMEMQIALEHHLQRTQSAVEQYNKAESQIPRSEVMSLQFAASRFIATLLSSLVCGVTASLLYRDANIDQTTLPADQPHGSSVVNEPVAGLDSQHHHRHTHESPVPRVLAFEAHGDSSAATANSIRDISSIWTSQRHQSQQWKLEFLTEDPNEGPRRKKARLLPRRDYRAAGVETLEHIRSEDEMDSCLLFRPTRLRCLFNFLNCDYGSSNEEDWRAHCVLHFAGNEPPNHWQCPICPSNHLTYGFAGWDDYMFHMASHMRFGEDDSPLHPNYSLFKYLWLKHIINAADLERLNKAPFSLPRDYVTKMRDNGEVRTAGEDDDDDGSGGGDNENGANGSDNASRREQRDNSNGRNDGGSDSKPASGDCTRDFRPYRPSKLALKESRFAQKPVR